MTQRSEPSRLSGPAHASQTLSQSGLSHRCGGTARESSPCGCQGFREALLRTSPLNSTRTRSRSCTRANGGLRRHRRLTLVSLWQIHCDGRWFILLFVCTYYVVSHSDLDQMKKGFTSFDVWGPKVCRVMRLVLIVQKQRCLPDMCPLCVHRLSSPLFSISLQSRSTKDS